MVAIEYEITRYHPCNNLIKRAKIVCENRANFVMRLNKEHSEHPASTNRDGVLVVIYYI
jgi:hypothetical protein